MLVSIVAQRDYIAKVLRYNPVAYWPQAEKRGPASTARVNSPVQNGVDIGVTLAFEGIGNGNTAPFFDGALDYNDVYTEALRDVFNGDEGTLLAWMRVSGGNVWSDGIPRWPVRVAVDSENFVGVEKTADGQVWFRMATGGVEKQIIWYGVDRTDWIPMAITFSAFSDEMRAYRDGAQQGITQTGLGVWTGSITSAVIGAFDTAPTRPWHGYVAHVALFPRALPLRVVEDLHTVVAE